MQRLIAALWIFWMSALVVMAQPAPILRNQFTTNAPGTPVLGDATFSGLITNQKAFRSSADSTFADDEFITEERLDTVVRSLASRTFFLWTNDHPFISGTRIASELQAAGQFLTNSLAVGSNQVTIWFTTNTVTSGVIPPGAYRLHAHMFFFGNGNPTVTAGWDLVRTNGSGVVTITSGETTPVTTLEISHFLEANLVTPLTVSTGDVVGARIYAIRSGGSSASLVVHMGSTTQSRVETENLTSGGGGSGEVNTASNLGDGVGAFRSKVGVDLQFKSFRGTNGATVTTNDLQVVTDGGGDRYTNAMNAISLACSNLAYVIGANGTNYTDSRSVNLTNAINSVSLACSNLAYAVGANGTNYTDSRSVNLTNAINSVSLACSNLAYAVGANATNFTYSIGANDTNYINSRSVNLTNAINSVSLACSNLAYSVGANGTNFTYSIGSNGTNYTDSRSVNLTNAINSVSLACSNLAYVIGANGTNYANAVLAQAVTNIANGSTNGTGWVGLVKTNTAQERIVKGLLQGANVTLTDRGTNVEITAAGSSTAPGGSTTMLQWNNTSAMDGTTNLGWDKVTGSLLASNINGTNATFFSLTSSNHVSTNMAVRAGGSVSNATVGGTLYVDTVAYTNCCSAIGTPTNMAQLSVPGNTLTNNGDTIYFDAAGQFANAKATTNRLLLLYGATTLLDTGTQFASNRTWRVNGIITRTGNAAQHSQATLMWDAVNVAWKITNFVGNTALDNGVANILKMQSGSQSNSVVTQNFFRVEYKPAYRP